jgi:L,D-peptidoglycan transpeptidase YkuD (ErfK/YbiS/YcfS/YnhG family)
MIIVKKSGYLKYKNFKYRCALGKAGINEKIKEGDNVTPTGVFKIIKIYYRADKIKNFKTHIKKIKIKKNMGWCDDIKSRFYNKEIKLPSQYSHEKFYRKDEIYDIICILDFNINPISRGKGSAIFVHVAKEKYSNTKGCVALKKEDLIYILSKIKKNTKIKIIKN